MTSIRDSEEIPSVTTRATVCQLCRSFAFQATTHGLRRVAGSQEPLRKLVWVIIFLIALAGCTYHCSFLVMKYLKFPKVTTTEEVHARELDFPALTVCNLNILKKAFLADQLSGKRNRTSVNYNKGFCFDSREDFLNKSNAKDLSDMWMNLGVTSGLLKQYGHQVYDLIVQCTYNSKDCFNQSITRDLPLVTENISITNYTSTRLGYCHTIILNQTTLGKVRRTGQTLGLTLTLNIEREHYIDLLSPEYGVRLMVHPRHSFPTIERGGVVLHPGTKTYISIRVRQIERLPAPFGDCTKTFRDSPLSDILNRMDNKFLLKHNYYTYEFCQTVCRDAYLLNKCECVEEQVNVMHKFCNPCNSTQDQCRIEFNRYFTSDENNACTMLCKPACEDVRYDLTLSRSEWPNMRFQEYVLHRWPELIRDFVEPNTTVQYKNGYVALNKTYINENFLRIHVFMQEMNYLHVKDIEAYTLPEMFADLGGCLGLYIGVSLISIIEVMELFSSVLALGYVKWINYSYKRRKKVSHSVNSKKRKILKAPRRLSTQALKPFVEPSPETSRPHAPSPLVHRMNGGRKARREDEDPSSKDNTTHLFQEELSAGHVCSACITEIQGLDRPLFHRQPPHIHAVFNSGHSRK